MKLRLALATLLLALFSIGVAQAAGSPINEDYTSLIGLAEKMLAAGKASDSTGFVTVADEASSVAKDQGNKGNSPRLQRISAKIKQAKKAVKGGDFEGGNKLIEEALVEMKKENPPPRWGGSSND